eukprot:scaffold39225_cov150-Skeletonema_dohrnii-CCMP3373.AAC.1
MYDRRTAHIRRPFSRVNGDFDSSSGHGSFAKHRTRDDLEASRSFWGGRKPNANQYGESRTPFRYRQDVGDSCHVGISHTDQTVLLSRAVPPTCHRLDFVYWIQSLVPRI